VGASSADVPCRPPQPGTRHSTRRWRAGYAGNEDALHGRAREDLASAGSNGVRSSPPSAANPIGKPEYLKAVVQQWVDDGARP
jgi:hypothetical protein